MRGTKCGWDKRKIGYTNVCDGVRAGSTLIVLDLEIDEWGRVCVFILVRIYMKHPNN